MFRWGVFNEPVITIKSAFELMKYIYRLIFVTDVRFNWTIKKLFKIFFASAIFPDLSSSAKKILFPEKLAKANAMLKKAGLPNALK